MFLTAMREAAAAYGLALSEQQYAQFARYYELLISWNEKMNLTAITAPQEVAAVDFIFVAAVLHMGDGVLPEIVRGEIGELLRHHPRQKGKGHIRDPRFIEYIQVTLGYSITGNGCCL